MLALADGTVYHGTAVGASGQSVGEVVFNTAMTGYQEILTDPSYSRQLVTLTYPHIGNTGTNHEDEEAERIHAAGLIVRDLPLVASSWRRQETLSEYLVRRGVVAIADLDTRALTRRIREGGAQGGCIATGQAVDSAQAVAAAQKFPGLAGADLAQAVTTEVRYEWTQGSWSLGDGHAEPMSPSKAKYHVVAYDFGIKRNILRKLADRGCRVTVVPAQTPPDEVLALAPEGVFLSNGPGDPEPCSYAIDAIAHIVDSGVPTFGICLGHQLLGLACGARTAKMKFGHHGANHPVKDCGSGRVIITSQNHGFCIDTETLPKTLRATHVSLFDGTSQGIHHTEKPAFSFQGHPEASPGPHDVWPMFDHFIGMMGEHRDTSR
jgi:carbamoyl-phosphate synthase small subunit